MALTRGELARKFVHMGVGLIAFALVYLGSFWSAVLAAGALAFNLFLLPRIGGRRLWREQPQPPASRWDRVRRAAPSLRPAWPGR